MFFFFFQNPIITVTFSCDTLAVRIENCILLIFFVLCKRRKKEKINYFNTYTALRMWPCGLLCLTVSLGSNKAPGVILYKQGRHFPPSPDWSPSLCLPVWKMEALQSSGSNLLFQLCDNNKCVFFIIFKANNLQNINQHVMGRGPGLLRLEADSCWAAKQCCQTRMKMKMKTQTRMKNAYSIWHPCIARIGVSLI